MKGRGKSEMWLKTLAKACEQTLSFVFFFSLNLIRIMMIQCRKHSINKNYI